MFIIHILLLLSESFSAEKITLFIWLIILYKTGHECHLVVYNISSWHLTYLQNVTSNTWQYECRGSGVGLSTKRTRVRILCCGVKTLGKFFHSTLLQSTQLYKWVPGYRQVVDMCTSSFRALIVACGWMLRREVEMVFDWTGLPGK